MGLEVSIKKKFGNFQLEADFSTEKNTYGLLGASGCGKSVTLGCIAGVHTPDSGTIRLNGRILFDSEEKINIPSRERKVGYLFQNYALFPNMTVEENLKVGIGDKHKGERTKKMLVKMYLTEERCKYPHQLSGGQQQRVALGRILLTQPEILLLDEPFSALDNYLKWQMEQQLTETLENFSGTTVLVTHNRGEAYRLCEETGIMELGKILDGGMTKELFLHPKTRAAALLSGCKNVLNAALGEGNYIHCLQWGISLKTSQQVSEKLTYVGIQANYLKEYKEGDINKIPCRVHKKTEDTFRQIYLLEPIGSAFEKPKGYYLRWDVSPKSADPNYSVGDVVYLTVSEKNVLPLV